MENQNLNNQKQHGIDKTIIGFLKIFDKSKFGNKDKILFFKELSYLLNGGVSIVDAIKIINDESQNYSIKEISFTILNCLIKGKSLSYALNRLPDYFDKGDYSIIKTGEMSGNLPTTLQYLSNEYNYLNDLKNKYIGAMIYPIILIIIAIIAILALFLLVLPSIFSISDSFQLAKLPRTTQTLRDISLFLQNDRKWLIGVLIGILVIGTGFLSTEKGKKIGFKMLFQIPLLGKMTKYFYLVKWCRFTKLMLSAGMNYIQIFQLLKEILGIPAYQEMLDDVIFGLNKGEKIYDGVKKYTDIVPSNVTVMIKVGEETANLENSLSNILNMYENELNNLINSLAKVIEPILLIFIGGFIVLIALGVFGLILQIMDNVGNI